MSYLQLPLFRLSRNPHFPRRIAWQPNSHPKFVNNFISGEKAFIRAYFPRYIIYAIINLCPPLAEGAFYFNLRVPK